MGGSKEVEWQFEASDIEGDSKAVWQAAEAAGLRLGTPKEVKFNDRFFDTADWKFYRAFAYLRVRKKGRISEATIKTFDSSNTGPRIRTELTEQLTGDLQDLAGPAGECIRALAGSSPLREIFSHSTNRTILRAFDGESEIAEIAIDRTIFENTNSELNRIEIEALCDKSAKLNQFVSELATRFKPCLRSKFAEGLASKGLSPELSTSPGLDVRLDSTMGELIQAAINVYSHRIRESDPGVRLGLDPEAVHNMRVATRRLRALLRLFNRFLPSSANRVRKNLAWLADALGGVRDLDVQMQSLEDVCTKAQVSEEDFAMIIAPLQARRSNKRFELLAALNSDRYSMLIADLNGLQERALIKGTRQSAVSVLPKIINRAYMRALRDGSRITNDSSAEEYHKLRLKCKRFRYAVDVSRNIYGKPARALCKALSELQDVLGQHQDALILVRTLHSVPEDWGYEHHPTALDAIRRIEQFLENVAIRCRHQFFEAFEKVFDDVWPSLEQRMLEMMADDVVRATRKKWERERIAAAGDSDLPESD
jgi:CHAD domain-containing protein